MFHMYMQFVDVCGRGTLLENQIFLNCIFILFRRKYTHTYCIHNEIKYFNSNQDIIGVWTNKKYLNRPFVYSWIRGWRCSDKSLFTAALGQRSEASGSASWLLVIRVQYSPFSPTMAPLSGVVFLCSPHVKYGFVSSYSASRCECLFFTFARRP